MKRLLFVLPVLVCAAFSGTAQAALMATGGTVYNAGGYTYNVFTGGGSLSVTTGGQADIFVVGGGGGGAWWGPGGGGAGGVILTTSTLGVQSYSVTVGGGGAGGTGVYNSGSGTTDGTTGSDSFFDSLLAKGGGGGRRAGDPTGAGLAGGSGGGGAAAAGGGNVAGQGNNGGAGSGAGSQYGGGGGGGAGGVGGAGSGSAGGTGGAGLNMTSWLNGLALGDSGFFASGGVGGTYGNNGQGTKPFGGGGYNGFTNGIANTGGGGAGGRQTVPAAGAGGSGIVIVRYLTLDPSIYYYDNDSSTPGFGTAGGTWAAPTPGPTPGWSTDSTGSTVPGNVSTLAGDTLHFGTATEGLAAGTITVSGTQNAGDMTFGSASGAITFSGGTAINLGGTATITVNNSSNTINTPLTGATVSLTKAGTGTLIFGGNNTYSGTTLINAGTLQVGAGSTSGTLGAGSVTNNGSLVFNRSNAITVTNAIGGSGALTQAGAGTTVLSANNSYGGTTLISAGVLQIGNGGTSGTLGTGPVTDNASLVINRSDAYTASNAISGTGSLTKSAAGTLTLSNSGNSYSGGTNISAGVINFVSGALGTTGAITYTGNSTLQWAAGNTQDISSRLSLSTVVGTVDTNGNSVAFASTLGGTSGGLTKAGAGTVTLGAANSYTGATTVSAGTLQLNHALATQNSTVTVNVNNGLSFGTGVGTFTLGGLAGTGNFNLIDTGATPVTVQVGNNNAAATYSGAMGGGGALSKIGSNTQILSGANSYSGTTTVSAGTLQIGAAGTAGSLSPSSAIVNNANLTFNRTDTLTQGTHFSSSAISGTGSLTHAGSGTLTLNALNSYAGVTTVTAGTLATTLLADGGSNSGIGSSPSAAGNLLLGNATTLRYTGAGSNTDRLFTINGTAAGHGATLDASGTGAVNFTNTGSLAYGTNNQTRTLTLTGTNAGNNTLAATINNNGSGATSLTKTGAGTWILGSANGYTGATTVSAGTLRAGASSTVLGNNSALTLADTAGAALDLNGNNVAIGSLAGGGATGGNVSLGSGTLTSGGNNSSTSYDGVISGAGGITKTGNGTWSLTRAHSYNGATTISGGTLKLDALPPVGGLVHRWSFTGNMNDSVGTQHGTAENGLVTVSGNQLVITGTGRMLTSQDNQVIPASKTLIAWTSKTNLTQYAGSALTIEDNTGGSTFDAIVYGERTAGQWMAGSNGFARTPVNNAGALETSTSEVMMSIVYTPTNYTIYRNGVQYGNTQNFTNISYTNPFYQIGRRHGTNNSAYIGSVNEARVYNTNLSAAQIASLFTAGPDTLPTAATVAALPATTPVNITASGAALDLNAATQTIASLAGVTGSSVTNSSATPAALTISNTSGSTTFSGNVTGPLSLVKSGNSTQVLAGNNTYSGTTTVNGGTLLVNGTHTGGGLYTVASGGTLGGSGSTASSILLNGLLSPGNSPGTFTTGSETWTDTGSFLFEINNATGTAGSSPGWDLQIINNGGNTAFLDLSGLSVGGFDIDIFSLAPPSPPDNPGNAINFNKYLSYDWLFVDADVTISSFNSNLFTFIDNFTNDTTGTLTNGAFSVLRGDSVSGGNNTQLYIHYQAAQDISAVPEPSTFALALLGLACLAVVAWRRRK